MTRQGSARATRYVIIAGTVLLTAGLDLGTKRWAEHNLATPDHLLSFRTTTGNTGTVGDLVRTRFPDMTNNDLSGAILQVPANASLSMTQGMADVADRFPGLRGFITFDGGDIDGFGRHVNAPDIQGKDPREAFAGLTLGAYLAGVLDHLSASELEATVATGTFPLSGAAGVVSPMAGTETNTLYLLMRRDIVVIPDFFDFSYVENPAGAFSMLSSLDEGNRRILFYTLSVVVIIVLGYLLVRPPTDSLIPQLALGAIMGGAIGNLVDRFLLNYVVDFIHMFYKSFHWPRYNIADIGITVGIIVLLLTTGFKKAPDKK